MLQYKHRWTEICPFHQNRLPHSSTVVNDKTLQIAEADGISPIKMPSQTPNTTLEMVHGLVTFQNHLLKMEQVIIIILFL